MNQPTDQSGASGPWMLITGLLLGAGLLVFMTWDGLKQSKNSVQVSDHVVELTEANWRTDVIDSDVPVVVDFSASWCPPCRAFAPTLDRIAERYKGKVKVGTLDVGTQAFEKVEKLQAQYEIRGIPYVMLFSRGKLVRDWRRGAPSETELAQAIDSVLK